MIERDKELESGRRKRLRAAEWSGQDAMTCWAGLEGLSALTMVWVKGAWARTGIVLAGEGVAREPNIGGCNEPWELGNYLDERGIKPSGGLGSAR